MSTPKMFSKFLQPLRDQSTILSSALDRRLSSGRAVHPTEGSFPWTA